MNSNTLKFFYEAARFGRLDEVEQFLERSTDINFIVNNSEHQSRETALIAASRNGHVDVAKLLIASGADIMAKDISGETALMAASYHGHQDIMELLIEKGADVDTTDVYGGTALMAASGNGYQVVAKLLLDNGADIDAKDGSGNTPLVYAAKYGHPGMVDLLLNYGADIEAADKNGITSILRAACRFFTPDTPKPKDNYSEIFKILCERGANIDEKTQGLLDNNDHNGDLKQHIKPVYFPK